MLTLVSITNPVYGNADGTHIDCQATFEELPNEVLPFGANAWDTEPHGIQIYNDLKAGKYGPIAPYVAPPAPAQPATTGTKTA